MMTLRPYQKDALEAVQREWGKGKHNTLVVSATGSGKTEMGLSVLSADLNGGRALWVAHRRELIFQPKERILAHWPELGIPGVVMGEDNECAAKVVIATIQTLASNGRLDQIFEHGTITHLVTDETHHCVSKTYLELYERMREHNPKLRHLGLTATPRRTDGQGLVTVFDSVAYRVTIKDLIKAGYLVPMRAFAVSLPVSFEGVRENEGGWSDDEAGEILSRRNAEDLIISTWEKHAKDRPTIGFCASVAQAYSLAQHFVDAGYRFEALDGTTPHQERKAILRRFQDGTTQGLINCAVLSEGWDAPLAGCLLQVRPTKSDLVYVQMIGRVLRTSPGKEDALILDFVPADARDMVMAGDVLGKPKEQRKAEEAARDDGIIGAFGINSDGEGIDGDPDKIIMAALDYFSTSRLCWYYQGDVASAAIGKDDTLAILMPDRAALARKEKADELRIANRWSREWDREFTRVVEAVAFKLVHINKETGARLVGMFGSWEEATDRADEFVSAAGLDILSERGTNWRKQAPTDKQVSLLRRLGIYDKLESPSRGTAARAITHFFAEKALKLGIDNG